jgi:anti-sigma factor RsiW
VGGDLRHAQVVDLLGAYALDAVDGDEREAVERPLGDCAQCRLEVAEHREVAGMLASGWLPAPEGVWDRIAASLEENPPPLRMPLAAVPPQVVPAPVSPPAGAPAPGEGEPAPPRPVVPLDERRRRRRLGGMSRAVAAVGIAASVALFGLLGVNALTRDDGPDDLTEVAAAAAQRPDAREVTMRSPDGALSAEAVVLSDGTGYLVETNLPELPPDRTYQLWAVVGGSKISVGVLGPKVGTLAFRASADVSAFAITNETAGGVIVSQQPPTVVGTTA